MPTGKSSSDRPKRKHGPQHLFIVQTGLKRSKSSATQVKKFVMKEIGAARRKPMNHPLEIEFAIWNPNAEENPGEASTSKLIGLNDAGVEALEGTSSSLVGRERLSDGIRSLRDAAGIMSPPFVIQTSHRPLIEQQEPQDLPRTRHHIERIWTGRLDPFCQYPVEMDHRSLQLLDHLYDDRYGNCPPFRELWLPLGLLDPAGFQQLLCNACLNFESLRLGTNPPENLEAIEYHNRAVSSINERISNVELSKTDGFLGSIIAFTCYFHATGDMDAWSKHINGAIEIVALRGGWQTVFANQNLAMVFYWASLSGAVTLDVPSLFEVPYLYLPATSALFPSKHTPQLTHITTTLHTRFPKPPGPALLTILHQVRSFSHFLASETTRTSGDIFRSGYFASTYMLPLIHRLLDLSGAGEALLEAIRLATILFFTEFRRLFGVMGVHCQILTRKLKYFLKESERGWGGMELLRLWCLAMGGMESEGLERAWYLAEFEREKGEVRWEDVMEEFKFVVWYEGVHDVMFGEFCAGKEKYVSVDPVGTGSRFGGYRPIGVA